MTEDNALPTDDLIAGRRSDQEGGLPADMPRWMGNAIRGIDALSRWVGLAVCRRIVERHGGRVGLDSVPGRGSVFTVVLPRTPRQPVEGA